MTNNYFDLSGKTALVTGCSSGIGEAIAVGLAEAGADIIGLTSTLKKGSRVESAVSDAGRKFSPYAFDLGKRQEVYNAVKTIKGAHSTIDILINNAGIIARDPAVNHTDEDWDRVLSVNLDATFILAREFAKEMLQRKSGKIIFTCSLLSFQGGINVASRFTESTLSQSSSVWSTAGFLAIMPALLIRISIVKCAPLIVFTASYTSRRLLRSNA